MSFTPTGTSLQWDSKCSICGGPAKLFDGKTEQYACRTHIPQVMSDREKAMNE